METTRLTDKQVEQLANDVRMKILAKSALIGVSEGEILIRAFRHGTGFDIKVTVTTN